MVVYPDINNFVGRLAVETIRVHCCGFFEQKYTCIEAGTRIDLSTGHTLCLGCHRITVESGLRQCDICDREYIDTQHKQNPNYETNCPRCVKLYGFDD